MTESTDSSLTEDAHIDESRKTSARGERITGMVAVAGVGAFFLFCVIESLSAGTGSLSQPGSGFWPLIIAGVGLGLSVWTLLMPSTTFELAATGSLGSVVAAGVALAAFPLTYYYLGLPITSFLLSMVLLKFIGKEGWVLSVVTSVLLAGGSYYVFVVLLRVPM